MLNGFQRWGMFTTAGLVVVLAAGCRPSTAPPEHGVSFALTVTEDAVREVSALGLDTPLSGRAFVIVTRTNDREPREQIGVSGVPFWGLSVDDLAAGETIELTPGSDHVQGFPLEDAAELPPGEYYVQPFFSVYTTFHRADGHTVSLHLNSGAGQDQWEAPGNLFGEARKLTIGGEGLQSVALELDSVIPPIEPLGEAGVLQQGNPPDTEWLKFVKIRSELLSEFWGRDMYIGANVLLPQGYEASGHSYPALYLQGHFPGRRAPFGFVEGGAGRGRSEGFSDFWASGDAPGMIAVTFRDANPYYDTSYSVNSANLGPYGDAITEELIPYLEEQFRIIPESWARVVAGGSTGGWEALAMQIFYPDYYGGSWGWCPDPVDFNYHQIVNIYEDDNAYFTDNEWHRVERPNARRSDGNVRSTVRQENLMERATGPDSRSGGQWAIWEAVFGPVGDNGYPRPIWDAETGEIDHATADYWRSNFDLHQYLRANWESIGPKLDGRIHVAVGDMDSYYLDNAVYLMEDFFKTASGPRVEASFEYGRRKPHCWTGYSPSGSGEDITNAEFITQVSEYFQQNQPSG
jgi:Putative esterase